VIPKRQLKRFLERPRKDFRNWKKLDAKALERIQAKLPLEPPLWRKLSLDQKTCALIGIKQPRFAFFSDPGIGKTITSLAVARYHRATRKLRRVLVLVPNLTNKAEWEREIVKHCPGLYANVMEGRTEKKWEYLRDGKNFITVETYAGFTRMVSKLVAKKGKKKKQRLKPDRKLIEEIRRTFQGFIFDESTGAKGYKSTAFRVCRAITRDAHMVLLLSGTPFGRDPVDLWAQMFLVDRGATLGETLGLFREAFYSTKVNHWGGFEHTFLRKKRGLLHRFIANRSIHYAVPEAELPDQIMRPIRVPLSDEQLDFYERAEAELVKARGDKQQIKLTFMRMRQLSSGFIGLPKDKDGKAARLVFDQNPKLDYLADLVESIPPPYKIVIVHEFIWSGDQISARLKQLGVKHVVLRGGVKDPRGALHRFEDEDCRAIVLNHQAGGFGLNLQSAAYLIYFESPLSAIMRRQTERRIVRRYSKHQRVFIYDLLAAGTVDERIREWHEEGRDLLADVLDGANTGLIPLRLAA
jgi:SNF2 family DNA or RNA helicase